MDPLLKTSGLGKSYGRLKALQNVDLEIGDARAIGLVGKNGAGKTTLLSILSGALKADTGNVNILGYTPRSIAGTGLLNILPQDANFKKGIPVKKQLLLFAQLQGMNKTEARVAVDELLNELGDSSFVNRPASTMSYGQRKKLGIVQAFLGKPKLVILDEPTAGLDPVAANDVRQLIRKLSTESAFIISSHNLYEIEDICSSVIILDQGKLVANKPISELATTQNRLNFTLDRPADSSLLEELQSRAGISELVVDRINPEKLSLDMVATEQGEIQIEVQKLLIDKGYVIVDFSRGKALIEGIMDLVDDEQGSKN